MPLIHATTVRIRRGSLQPTSDSLYLRHLAKRGEPYAGHAGLDRTCFAALKCSQESGVGGRPLRTCLPPARDHPERLGFHNSVQSDPATNTTTTECSSCAD